MFFLGSCLYGKSFAWPWLPVSTLQLYYLLRSGSETLNSSQVSRCFWAKWCHYSTRHNLNCQQSFGRKQRKENKARTCTKCLMIWSWGLVSTLSLWFWELKTNPIGRIKVGEIHIWNIALLNVATLHFFRFSFLFCVVTALQWSRLGLQETLD